MFYIVDIEISIYESSRNTQLSSIRLFFISMSNFDPFGRVYYPLDVVDKFKNALYLVVELNSFFTKLLDRRKIGLLLRTTIVLNDIASDR